MLWFNNKLCLLLFVAFLNSMLVRSQSDNSGIERTQLCQQPPYWSHNGEDVMYEQLGKVTLVALMELQCTFCKNQIQSLVRLLDYVRENSLEPTKILIIAPMNESTVFVDYHRQMLEPKGITVLQESRNEPIWSVLNGYNNDFFLYDACGRLNFHIPYPQSFAYYHYTVNTIYSVHKHHKCGQCTHYPPRRQPYYPPTTTPKQVIKAWVETRFGPGYNLHIRVNNTESGLDARNVRPGDSRPDHPDYQRPGEQESIRHEQPDSSAPVEPQSPDQRPETNQEATETTTRRSKKQKVPKVSPVDGETTTKKPHKMRHQKGNKEKKDKKKHKTTSTTTTTTTEASTTIENQNEVDEVFEFSPDEESVEIQLTSAVPSITETDFSTAQIPATEIETTTITTTPKVEIVEEDYDYEEILVPGQHEAQHLGATNKAAPTPTTTTTTPATTTTTRKPRPRTRKPKIHRPPGLSSDCSSFTELSCFEMQEAGKDLHPCCYKGIYLTAVCQPDMCTSQTYHLCCFQKFQQARYQCCHNDSLPFDRPDDFSKCCYDVFVHDDPCCPSLVAYSFWSHKTRIAELCLPTTEVLYSGVTLEAEMKDKSIVKLDLGKFKSLTYQCPAASKRNDFFYWEPEGPPQVDDDEADESHDDKKV